MDKQIQHQLLTAAAWMTAVKETELLANAAWRRAAKKCRYNQIGGDGMECAYIGEGSSDDPFCYADNCPGLAKEI